MMLADMLGYDELELVTDIIKHRKELLKAQLELKAAERRVPSNF